ncbi:penicillin acylase family protein [Rossellomorea marisflavi]|uniref:Penicillin acylase family protein n=1 Tax=Rossellomorea marisflavi TaxID=189381 RepID=A0A5D4RR82_9BACI|nr:penicillin acylase family protein [Rossellomorea marisflavi]
MEINLKKNRKRTIIIGGVAFLFLCLTSLIFYADSFIGRSLPQLEGELAVPGLSGDVEVVRDSKGVPHLSASSDRDLYMAQGYIQAQDRLFQMDLSRRQASGRLSEVVGEKAVDRDKFFRTLGLRRAAEASLEGYSPEVKEILGWFADGVNAYIQDSKETKSLPAEFTLLGYEPEKWTEVDSLTIGKYMAFDLGGHWQGQAFRYWALQSLPEDKAMDLFPSYPEDAPTIIHETKELSMKWGNAISEPVIPPEMNGSNNWVVSGSKSESGYPMLADDPHLSLGSPSIWYQMHLESPDVNVSGVIFAGIPGIILGHNETIAWGVTNTGPDVQDLYIEKRHKEKKNHFLYDGKWEEAEVIKEPIAVKDSETIPYEVTVTRHGPIVSEFANQDDSENALSMRWTALDPSLELQAIIDMNKASNWTEFEKAMEDFHTPTQNFVFADNDGTIAYKANGKIPIRKKGDGLLPVPGWTSDYEWTGFIPYEELPRVVNPAEGYIATANNKVIGDEYPYHISHHWAGPYRYMRISEVLESKEKLTKQDMKDLQHDHMNLQAREFVPLLLDALEGKEVSVQSREALQLLADWDYEDDADEAAPLLFHHWMDRMSNELFDDSIPNDMMKLFEGKQNVVDELIRKALKGKVSPWFTEQGGFESFLVESLSDTLEDGFDRYGSNMDEWAWGDYHRVYFENPLSSASSILEWFLNRRSPEPVGGSRVTVGAASYNDEGIVNHGGSWRFIIDTVDMSQADHIVGPGQSGHFKSPWYDDQIDDWIEGKYHETTLKPPADGKQLRLVPKT